MMINYLLVFIGILTSALAQIMLKKSSDFEFLKEFKFFLYFFLAGGFYVFSFGVYTYVLKIFNISKISPVMTIGTMILVVFSGFLFFNEVISWKQVLGILLGILSIILILK